MRKKYGKERENDIGTESGKHKGECVCVCVSKKEIVTKTKMN